MFEPDIAAGIVSPLLLTNPNAVIWAEPLIVSVGNNSTTWDEPLMIPLPTASYDDDSF